MVREIVKTTTIKVSKEIHDRLIKDKKHFEKTIGQGKQKWFINDVLKEYIKILNMQKKE
jgi:hypothetical protein